MEGLSVSVLEFSKRVGVSHTWIGKLVKKGVLKKDDSGLLPVAENLELYKKYADGIDENRRKSLPVDEKRVLDSGDSVTLALNKAKLAEKTYQARLKELDYKVRTGELLEREKVDEEAAWLAEKVKSKLMAIPPRVSSMCEGRIARDIEEIISDAINDALNDLQKLRYDGPTDSALGEGK